LIEAFLTGHTAIKSRSGHAEADCDLGDRDVGAFEQRANRLDLFWGELRRAPSFTAASARGFQASDGPLTDKIAFEP